ncbi:hypothetical protein MASR2M117_04000 [Paludibacter sp.]
MKNRISYTGFQLTWLVVLRVLIGWYFLFEGLTKIMTPNWTSYTYLRDSQGLFAPFFTMLTDYPILMSIVNSINMYGLTLIGICMIVGCLTKLANIGAIALLSLYYLSHPPMIDVHYLIRPEGSYMWVDKNLVMLGAIAVLMVFPTSKIIGLDRFILRKCKK